MFVFVLLLTVFHFVVASTVSLYTKGKSLAMGLSMAHRQAPGQYKEEPGHDSVSHILLCLHTVSVTNIAPSTRTRKTWRVWEDAVFHDQCQASSDAVLR